jgi:hypothetical protein
MTIWYNYTVILPLVEEYKDDGSRDLFLIPVNVVNGIGRFEVSAVGTLERIELIRVVATFDSDVNLTPQQIEIIETLKTHLIATLRLTYDLDIQEFCQGTTFLSLGAKDMDVCLALTYLMTSTKQRN